MLAVLVLLLFLYLLQSLLYNRFWDKGLKTEISFQEEYAAEDEQAQLIEVIVNDKLLPLPVLEIDFHMDKGLRFTDEANSSVSDRTYRRDVFALGVRQKITRTLPYKCVKRGYYLIDKAGLNARNLLLTRKYLTSFSQNTEFYVLPRPVSVQRIAIPFSKVMGTVLSHKRVYDDPFEFAGLRSYTKSDPMKYINWKATARTGELLVNLHESTLSQKVKLILDMEGLGVQQADTLNEEAVRIAASLCTHLLNMGVEVDVLSNGTDVLTGKPMVIPGVTGAGSVLAVRKKFACVLAGNDLPTIVNFLPDAGGSEDLLVLISRNQKEALTRELSQRVGKGWGLQIIPYRDEHPELPEPGNVQRFWWEA